MQTVDVTVLLAILAAAVLHPAWNALGKAIPDRLVSGALIGLTHLVIGGIAVPLLPVPASSAWPFALGSVVLQSVYLLLLMSSYQVGDFAAVYPLARGISPLLVTVAAVTVLGEQTSVPQLVGVAAVCGGLGLLFFAGGRPQRGAGDGLAAVTGVVIATYTLLDGVGVRRSGTPLGYAMWLFLLQEPVLPLLGFCRRGPALAASLRRNARLGILGGVLSLVSYAIVVWARSRAPLASVATLRETGVVFAALIVAIVLA